MQRNLPPTVWRPMAVQPQPSGSSCSSNEPEWTSGTEQEGDLSATCSCRLERVEEDVLVVSVQRDDGCLFRGALLKVKSWPCPDIPPLDVTSAPDAVASTVSGLSEDGMGAGVGTFPKELLASVPDGEQVPLGRPNPVMEPISGLGGSTEPPAAAAAPQADSDQTVNSSEGRSDFAAIQYRWSYFQKNLPQLPRKNIQSKREKEKLEAVPKLRPRNFLCTRCKFALPGFTQPQTPASVPESTDDANGIAAATPSPPTNATPLSPSHIRKRKPPVKRTIVRPSYIMDAYPTVGPDFPGINSMVSSESSAPVATEQRKSTTHRSKRNHGAAKEKEDPLAVATILSSPTSSGDSGLKIKFKLSSGAVPADIPSVNNKPKRAKRAKAAPEEDEDEFMWPPKLRIDDAAEEIKDKESPDSPEESSVQVSEPVVSDVSRPMVTLATPAKPKRRGRPTAKVLENEAAGHGSIAETTEKQPEQKKARTRDAILSKSESDADNLPKARSVDSCVTKDGRTFNVGDVVWGKLTGYPWWPGKINHIVVCDDPMLQNTASSAALTDPRSPPVLQYQEAQIEWYGQKSSISYIEVMQLSHYVEDYQKKYKPKERAGGYPEAIKAANAAANRPNRNTVSTERTSEPARDSVPRGRGRGRGKASGQRRRVVSDEDVEEPDILSQLARETLDKERAQAVQEPSQSNVSLLPSAHESSLTAVSGGEILAKDIYNFEPTDTSAAPHPHGPRSGRTSSSSRGSGHSAHNHEHLDHSGITVFPLGIPGRHQAQPHSSRTGNFASSFGRTFPLDIHPPILPMNNNVGVTSNQNGTGSFAAEERPPGSNVWPTT
ncbi:PWWP domain-containing protein 2A-like [Paramacrobiotus metropolitanus]|uniref:PWWP domain-containing protein 2A-like n=1 Tax=Paramacrobiotus metropolitanus TaxID=2943436 RepID=UPI002445B56B|nr:PWWP domain-containing protein 2A-like [Paramacrobiotus metropolitanus]